MQPCLREELRGKILQRRRVGKFGVSAVSYRPNQVLPRHSHEHAYVSVALRGAYMEESAATKWECRAGGTIFHLPGESHQNQFYDRGARLLVLEFEGDFLTDLARQGVDTGRQITLNSPHCMQLATRLERSLHQSDPISALCAEGLCLELLSEALQPNSKNEHRPPDWLVRVHQILNDRYREHVTLAEIAGEVHVHPVHLARAFRKRYDCCMGDFIRQLRVEAACRELLETDATIAEIAARMGFTDQSHFSRVMKRHAGISPAEFRNSANPADALSANSNNRDRVKA